MEEILLKIENLKTYFFTRTGIIKAVDGITLQLEKGRTLGLVGESGCGKSTLGFSILRLVSEPGKIIEGSILLQGKDLLTKSMAEIRTLRGEKISMIFQNPMTILNPVMQVGEHVEELFTAHKKMSKKEAEARTRELLASLEIPEYRLRDYPHQFSGGMKQRIMIALALALQPDLVIADEPTTALDVIVQAHILELLKNLRKKYHLSLILISHDLSVVAELADTIAVMYAGKLAELAPAEELYRNPLHPYTRGLLNSIPRIHIRERYPTTIPGSPPDLIDPPSGCRFHPRCESMRPVCATMEPPMVSVSDNHQVYCTLYH